MSETNLSSELEKLIVSAAFRSHRFLSPTPNQHSYSKPLSQKYLLRLFIVLYQGLFYLIGREGEGEGEGEFII